MNSLFGLIVGEEFDLDDRLAVFIVIDIPELSFRLGLNSRLAIIRWIVFASK